MNKLLAKFTLLTATAFCGTLTIGVPQSEALAITPPSPTIVNQAIDFVQPPYPSGEPLFDICADEGLCQPNQTVSFFTGSGIAPNINNNNNDTSFTFNKITYRILDDAEWGNVTSNYFNVQVSGKVATFTGLLAPGTGFRVERTLGGDANPVNLSVSLTAIPEPFTILGAATALGFGACFKRKVAKK